MILLYIFNQSSNAHSRVLKQQQVMIQQQKHAQFCVQADRASITGLVGRGVLKPPKIGMDPLSGFLVGNVSLQPNIFMAAAHLSAMHSSPLRIHARGSQYFLFGASGPCGLPLNIHQEREGGAYDKQTVCTHIK